MVNEDRSGKGSFLPPLIMGTVAAIFLLVIAVQVFAVVEPWLFPLHMVQGSARHITANIIIGPYPHPRDLARLKEQGVVEVVSLLSPSVTGENRLLDQERRTVKEAGLKFYNYPLGFLPLRSDTNKQTAKDLATRVAAK